MLLAASAAAFLGYCLGFAQGRDFTQAFTVTTQFTASQQTLQQGGDWDSHSEDLTGNSGEECGERIDLNHADAETLQQLPGIGPKRAEAIIRYREENGIFVTVDEVLNVPGIGPNIYEQIKGLVTVDYR